MGILYMSIRYTDKKLEGVQFLGRFGVISDIRREIGYTEDSCTGWGFSVKKTISGVLYIFSTRSFRTPEGPSAYFSMALEAKDAYEVSKTLSDKMIKEVMSVLVLPKVGEDPFLWMTTGAQLWYEMRKCNAGDKCMISHKYHPMCLLVAIGLKVNSEFVDFWGKAEELDRLMRATHQRLDKPVEGFCSDQLVTGFTSSYGLLHLIDRSFVLAVRGTMEPYSCLSVLNSVSKELSSDTRELDMVEACSDLKCLDDKMLIYPGKEPRQGIVYAKINRAFGTDETFFKFTGHLTSLKVITDAVEANEHLLANSNTNTVGFTNSSVISVNGSKFYLYIHKVSSIHKASSGTFILVFGENIEENERMGLLTQLATCKLYGPVRDLVLRANGGGEYTDESEDCRLHLNYCFVVRDDTILMECVDFIGDESEVWDISSIGKEWIKSSSQGLRTSKEETHEKGEYDFYAFLLKDDIGCFVSSSFLPEDRDGNVQLEDNFVFNHLVVFVKKVVDAVKSVHDPQVESLGARVKEIMAKTNDELRRMMSSDE